VAKILYLVHRLPYPPNKGDKVRSFHLLKHLAKDHRIYLGTFIDDPEDEAYLDTVRAYCADAYVAKLNPPLAKAKSLVGLLSGEPLTLPYYRDPGLAGWVRRTVETQTVDAAVVFCSAMAPYVPDMSRLRTLVDFVDVDSAKWTQYAPNHRWPMSWLYRREGECLLEFERSVARRAARSFFVTENETALFVSRAPECADKVEAICNGVDADFFSPEHDLESPYAPGEIPLVFTGAMDYWPNIDGVSWFAREVLPTLLKRSPQLRFYIVGRSPAPAVTALADEHVVVTGTVPDIRPYLSYARVVVAPLRVARGIQNKILEAMAMAVPVVAAAECAGAVDAVPGKDLLTAGTPEEFVGHVERLLDDAAEAEVMGRAARRRVLERYSWDAHLARIDDLLLQEGSANPAGAAA
jgi:sugar transferase (PEP-CTERM/EpsH1 system associated)